MSKQPKKNNTMQTQKSEKFVVEWFEGKRMRKGKVQYRVKWAGYNDKSWEPAENLITDLGQSVFDSFVTDYLQRNNGSLHHQKRKISGFTTHSINSKKSKAQHLTGHTHYSCFFLTPRFLMKFYKFQNVLVWDDPTGKNPMQLSRFLQETLSNINVESISDKKQILTIQKQFPLLSFNTIHNKVSDYLETKIADTFYSLDMVVLDYRASAFQNTASSKSVWNSHQWLHDIKLLLDYGLLSPKGMIHVTFEFDQKGQLLPFVQFLLEDHVRDTKIVSFCEFQQDNKKLLAFTIVRRSDWARCCVPLSIARLMIPCKNESVLVSMPNGKTWNGRFICMLDLNNWKIYSETGKRSVSVDRNFVVPKSLLIDF